MKGSDTMSTRANIEFWNEDQMVALLFVMCDGYPSNVIPLLQGALENAVDCGQDFAAMVLRTDRDFELPRPRIVPALEPYWYSDYDYRVTFQHDKVGCPLGVPQFLISGNGGKNWFTPENWSKLDE
jgi:hypothetical protein